MSILRLGLRLPLVIMLLLFGAPWIYCAVLWDRARNQPLQAGAARRALQLWCRWVCRLLGIRFAIGGEPLLDGPVLVAANHISWLDIPCVAAFWPLGFLSKAEVRGYPLIGPVATALGTLYIERGGPGAAAEAGEHMRRRLVAGRPVLFFPEGTTSDGNTLLPFRPRLFQAAIDAGVPVQPLSIDYLDRNGERSSLAPHVIGDPLPGYIWRLLRGEGFDVVMRLGKPLRTLDRGRTELARRVQGQIAAALGLTQPQLESRQAQPQLRQAS